MYSIYSLGSESERMLNTFQFLILIDWDTALVGIH